MLTSIFKRIVHGICLIVTFPLALVACFGRFETGFGIGAQTVALMPGLPGNYLRIAFYRMTLQQCPLNSRVDFGTFFAHPQAIVGQGVYIGAYCVLGRTKIGERTQIASSVQILSGGRQHGRDAEGHILGAETGTFETVTVGADCWIGAGSIVMAEVGDGSTVGAGSVVVYPIPPGCVAVGSPARVVRPAVLPSEPAASGPSRVGD